MASPNPWIADTLIDAIDAYLAFEFERKKPDQIGDVPFKYTRSTRHLSILVEKVSSLSLRLIDWQVSPTGKSVEARVTDGEIEITTNFLRTAFDIAQHSHKRTAELYVGALLKLHDFEFRLADSCEPTQVTLHLRRFDILLQADTTQVGKLSAIGDHQLARNFLSMWKDFEKSRVMDVYPSSPQDIHSQVGNEAGGSCSSDVENQDPTSVSQAQFATQIPLRGSPKQLRRHDKRIEPAKVLEGSEKTGHVDQVPAEDSPQSHVSQIVDEESVMQRNGDKTSASPELTQMQIVVPSTSGYVEEADSGNMQYDEDNTQLRNSTDTLCTKNRSLNLETIPDSVMQLLRSLRRECQDGRYIPRRLQSIPKDQAKLLESEDRWQPPLVGRIQRPGAVPLDLLNRLTERADQTNAARLSTQPEPPLPNTDTGHDTQTKVRSFRENSIDPSDDASRLSEGIEWSSSPLRAPIRQNLLPPDSSPLRPATTQPKEVNEAQEENSASLFNVAEKIFVADTAPRVRSTGSFVIDDISMTVSTEAKDDANLPSSTSRSDSRTILATLPRTIQVKRTPFQTKEISSVSEMPDSSALMVPATFDERAIPMSKESIRDTRIVARLSDKALIDDDQHDFEMDTSEDEIALKRGRSDKHSQSATSGSKRAKLRTQPEDGNVHNGRPARSINLGEKRKVDDQPSRPQKRVKASGKVALSERATASEYDRIDQDRARQRREFLSRIGRKREVMEQTPSLITPVLVEKKRASSPVSHPPIAETWGSSPPIKAQIDTSETHASIHPILNNLQEANVLEQHISAVSRDHIRTSTELYSKFKSTYPSYGGQKMHFDAACQILKRLHLHDKATHQLLWDDFVFRHFHDYRSYLQDVMENFGDALPYEKFYQEFVEQPTCLQRLIRPAYINNLLLGPVTTGRLSSGPNSFATPGAPHLEMTSNTLAAASRSITADGSVSNIAVTKKCYQLPSQQERQHRNMQAGELEYKDVQAMLQKESSQESRSSVKIWLERAAGAESPILGTPEVSVSQNMNIPVLELADEDLNVSDAKPTSTKGQVKRRSLPWQNSQDFESSQSRLGAGEIRSTTNVEELRVHYRQNQPSKAPKATAARSQPLKPISPSTMVHQGTIRTMSESQSGAPETAFTRFAALYEALPGERKALQQREINALKLVNIFSWRR